MPVWYTLKGLSSNKQRESHAERGANLDEAISAAVSHMSVAELLQSTAIEFG
jgi:hypothetical protein